MCAESCTHDKILLQHQLMHGTIPIINSEGHTVQYIHVVVVILWMFGKKQVLMNIQKEGKLSKCVLLFSLKNIHMHVFVVNVYGMKICAKCFHVYCHRCEYMCFLLSMFQLFKPCHRFDKPSSLQASCLSLVCMVGFTTGSQEPARMQ